MGLLESTPPRIESTKPKRIFQRIKTQNVTAMMLTAQISQGPSAKIQPHDFPLQNDSLVS